MQNQMAAGMWSEPVKVHSYEVDFKHDATLECVCRYFLEAAWNHAEALGVGFSHLAAQNKYWVLSRLVVEARRYPRWGEALQLRTWPRAARTIFALRDFELVDAKGEPVVAGSSAWLVLDGTTRKPQRLEALLELVRPVLDKMALGQDPGKLPPSEGESALTAQIHYSDIDANNHLISTRYIGLLLDSYAFNHHRAHAVRLLEVNYVGETCAGETLSVLSQETAPGDFAHSMRKADGREACRARLRWEKIVAAAAHPRTLPG